MKTVKVLFAALVIALSITSCGDSKVKSVSVEKDPFLIEMELQDSLDRVEELNYQATKKRINSVKSGDIYEGRGDLSVSYTKDLGVWFGFQNPEYDYITDIKSITLGEIDTAIVFIDGCLNSLNKVNSDEVITGVSVVKYDFNNTEVYLGEDGYKANKKTLTELRKALVDYKSK